MKDRGIIVFGVIVFLGLFTFPFWYGLGQAVPVPKVQLPKDQKACVAPTEFMKTSHMQMLNEWRDYVVRDGLRVFVAADGKKYNMSLSNQCMKCHAEKTKFCDQCHNYLGVAPYCWDCHVAPKEGK